MAAWICMDRSPRLLLTLAVHRMPTHQISRPRSTHTARKSGVRYGDGGAERPALADPVTKGHPLYGQGVDDLVGAQVAEQGPVGVRHDHPRVTGALLHDIAVL
ncbi:hypothetical protein ADK47_04555 [Streptomyces rimosus subsp. rimosus]|nr:hypothetical protein DF17_35645 [Streptomyces rimosus]KOG67089.1 hypothetical protein ADK78_41880 [Kitasatospora aureofaciens]KOT44670.1 hypothetical protein ADK42_04675 [Streptomyces rimosus subsp. rimosus]KOT45780.1 hypothetical protein ADK84_04060 [Streptomyces sp. NRRL WC-3701]KEF18385.1 hypothetical protein DF18_22750 [Streptomyces rimosus]